MSAPRSRSSRKPAYPASVWRDKEFIDKKSVDAGVIVLRTRGCSHFHRGGCSMCGYNIESVENIASSDIVKQFDSAVSRLGDVSFLKVYTSGSFLDEHEIPEEVANHILAHCRDNSRRLLFESRPEYVTSEKLDAFKAKHDDLEVALGLESANDRVLRYSINKGFTVADYERAASVLGEKGIPVRTYILLKPPYITESEAIADSISTARLAARFSKTLSLNPVNVQKGTKVERLWKSWSYRPPWLWSVLEVLREASSLDRRVVCDPVGAGKDRGAHNCGLCDEMIIEGIRALNSSQDLRDLVSPECECKDEWRELLELEGFIVGGTPDLQRFFRPLRSRK